MMLCSLASLAGWSFLFAEVCVSNTMSACCWRPLLRGLGRMLVAHSLNSKAKIHISLHFFSKNDDFSIVFFKKKTNLNVFTQSIWKTQASRLSKSRNALFKQKKLGTISDCQTKSSRALFYVWCTLRYLFPLFYFFSVVPETFWVAFAMFCCPATR